MHGGFFIPAHSHGHVFLGVRSGDDLFAVFSDDEQDDPDDTRQHWKMEREDNRALKLHNLNRLWQQKMSDVYSPQLMMQTLSM